MKCKCKKAALVLMGAMLSLSTLWAGGKQEPEMSEKAEKKVKITVMTRFAGTDSMAPVWADFIEMFEAENPGIEVIDNSIAEENAYNNKLKVSIASGDTPDLFYWPGVAGLVPWAENNVIMDIAPLLEDKEWVSGFVDGAFDIWDLEKYGVKGHYAVPYGFFPEVIFYNKALFAKAGAEVPETMEELYVVIDKLNAIGVTPWGAGAKDNWRTGHIHNNLIYRAVGVEKVKDLGTRTAKWTEEGVVDSLAAMQDLKSRGAFQKGFVGVDYDTEKVDFFSGKSAMVCNGAWFIGDVSDSESPYKDDIGLFAFPYFADKPQYKGDSVLFTSAYLLSGTMSEAEKEATLKFTKFITSQERQQMVMDRIQRIGSNRNVTVDASQSSPLMKDMMSYMATITSPGGDYFDYDPNPAMIDVSRVAIIEMLINKTPLDAAEKIQKEVDSFVKRNN